MNEQITLMLAKPWVIPTAVGVAAFSAGAGVGYILGNRETKQEAELYVVPDNQLSFFDEGEEVEMVPVAETKPETKQVAQGTRALPMEESFVDSFDVDMYEEFELELDAFAAIEEDELADAEPIVDNVFAATDHGTWNYERELKQRTPTNPYVIHQDEFVNDEMGFNQTTIVYYAGDDIMADEEDTPMYGYSRLLGELKFGHGSKDPAIVYIRNEKSHSEWEVMLHQGRFEVEVLGHTIEQQYEEAELKHSHELHRFRDE